MKQDIDTIISLMKQYTIPKSKDELGEQGDAAGGGGTSSGGGEKPEYPTVTKWSSGRKFGPTYNPDQKTWSTNLTRGKANTLL
jgi:hypothetical protein